MVRGPLQTEGGGGSIKGASRVGLVRPNSSFLSIVQIYSTNRDLPDFGGVP